MVIHSFNIESDDQVCLYLEYVKSLMHIRHENIVSYMGASMDESNQSVIRSVSGFVFCTK